MEPKVMNRKQQPEMIKSHKFSLLLLRFSPHWDYLEKLLQS